MISKEGFCGIIDLIIRLEKREGAFVEALQAYAGETDFTYFHSDLGTQLVHLLALSFGVQEKNITSIEDDLSWWLWDCPNQGQAEDRLCTVSKDTSSWVLKTPDDLYEYLVDIYTPHTVDPIQAQTQAIKFACSQIRNLVQINATTKNHGWASRQALLELMENKIRDEYFLRTGEQSVYTTPNEFIILSKRGAKNA